MRITTRTPWLRIGPALGVALLVGACPADREPEVAPDTLIVAPGEDPAPMPHEAQTIPLRPAAGQTLEAEVIVTPVAVQTRLTVHLRSALPNHAYTAHLITGSCDAPGPLTADLQPVVTGAGGIGMGEIVVDVAPDVVVNGNHAVQVRTDNGRDGVVVACGEIPAHPVLHGTG